MNIVIVDNDQAILRSLGLLMDSKGHDTTVFADPRGALLHVSRGNPVDVLLLDYSMPEMNGDKLLAMLKPKLARGCRIIMMSAHNDLRHQLDLEHLGIGALLGKPIEYSELEDALTAQSGGMG